MQEAALRMRQKWSGGTLCAKSGGSEALTTPQPCHDLPPTLTRGHKVWHTRTLRYVDHARATTDVLV